jgi:hypothetical protein
MSKSQIAPKGYRQFIPGLKFQKMSEVTCRMLTAPLYKFMHSIQDDKAEEEEHQGSCTPVSAASPESDPDKDAEEGPDAPADENLQASSAQRDDGVQDPKSDGEEEEE